MGGCGVCGEQNPDGARFCSACGAPLGTGPAQSRRVRRSVTVLFTDIAGFTSLAGQLDPELLHAVTQRYFAVVREIVERHGGVVEKYIGDAVMAAFGVPVLHEDDALRAVRAASEIGPSLGELNAELSATTGRSIQVRIGVNTGEVIAGDAASGATFVTGEAVNVAARLEQTAEPGDILLGPKTYRLVRKQITAELLAPIAVKGITEPLVVHRLVSVDGTAAARGPQMATPLVGRDAELAVLQDAYARAVSTRVPQLVTVLGPPGIGKSRLVAEFASSTAGALSVKGRCLAYGEGITYWPIAEIVRGAAGISEADTREEALARVQALMAGAPDGKLVARRVAAATGLERSGAAHEELRWAIRRFIKRLAEQQPLIVIIEDIHWAEPTLLDVIEHLVVPTAEIPMLLACPARLDLLDRRPAWSGDASNMRTVTLEGLPGEGADRLLLEIPGGAALPDDVRAKLLDLSEGNPLFLEEIVGTLVETGDLRPENGSWIWAGSAAAVPVPPTVEALIAGRLEVLPPDELIVLERAAVIGRAFDHRTLGEMLSTDQRLGLPELDRALSELLRKRVITEEPAVVSPDPAGRSFRFRHQLIRDGAYARVSKSDRAELHEWFALWLERDVGDRLAEYEEIVGHHFEVASRYRRELGAVAPAEHLGQRAAGHLGAAARRAWERLDPSAATTLAQRSADLLPAGNPHRVDLLLMSAQASHYLGQFRASEAKVGSALAEAREASLVREEAWARLRSVLLRSHLSAPGHGDAVLDVTDAVMPVFTEIGDDDGLSVALRARVGALLGKGDLRAAEDCALGAVDHAVRSGDRMNLRNAHITWAEVGSYGETTVPEALERAEFVFGLYPGQLRVRVEIGGLLAMLHAQRLEIETSRRLASQAQQTAIELNVPWLMAGMRNLRGNIEWIAGNGPAALTNWRAALEMWRQHGDDEGVPFAAAALAEALAASGQDDDAIAMADLADQKAGGNYLDMELLVRGVRALVAARRGQADEALAIVTEDARRTESSPDLWLRAHVLLGRAAVLAYVGDIEAARSDASGAMDAAQSKGDLALAARARKFLDELAARATSRPG